MMASQAKSLTKGALRDLLNLAVGEVAESVETIAGEVSEDPTLVTSRQRQQRARAMLDGEIDRLKKDIPGHLRNLAIELAVALLKR